jgi:plasmid stabilization system protein ParE
VTRPLVLWLEADRDLVRITRWYNRQQSGLGRFFWNQTQRALDRIESNPDLYTTIWLNVRVGRIPKFPYLIYYRLRANRAEVFGILHARRGRRAWRSRLG